VLWRGARVWFGIVSGGVVVITHRLYSQLQLLMLRRWGIEVEIVAEGFSEGHASGSGSLAVV
jgi:hypothetical protein